MINWDKELEKIFEDPLIADVTAPRKRTTSSDRLIAGFQEILSFYEANGRLPEDNPTESSLYHNWLGVLKYEKKIERCRPFDDLGILPQPASTVEEPQAEYLRELTEEEQLEVILKDPLLEDIKNGADLGLFDIPEYMHQRLDARKEAEYVGKRRPCEDFDKYADGFNKIQLGLKSGTHKLIKFSVKLLKVGSYFVEDGMIGYLAAFEDEGVNRHGNRDGRTRVIYENGSESDIRYKTITKNLSVTGYSVMDCADIPAEDFEKSFTITDKDVESGTIYVLRSKSTRPEIAAIKDLYKIGFTITSVDSRIANAKNEPTYLCSDVEVVATWKVYNVKSSTFEALIHKLFASVQLQATVDGHRPKEWFIVPLRIIEEAIQAIISGKAVEYDPQFQQLVYL
ncbi:MAG: GIY-YIG nuclease family protein [Bacteroidales bacterium]|nr:GIY-YIG nuclease family protein [Bacteroidales bacterium]